MAHGIIKAELKAKIKRLSRMGYYSYQIAKELDIPESVVIKVLKPKA